MYGEKTTIEKLYYKKNPPNSNWKEIHDDIFTCCFICSFLKHGFVSTYNINIQGVHRDADKSKLKFKVEKIIRN